MKRFFKSFGRWVKGVWFAFNGKQIVPTERKDWSVDYGSGGQD
jgi:hypothetical protein